MSIRKEAWFRKAEENFWFEDMGRTSPLTLKELSKVRSKDLLKFLDTSERRYDRQSFDEWRTEMDHAYDVLEGRGVFDSDSESRSEQEREDKNLALRVWRKRKREEDPEWASRELSRVKQWAKDNPEKSRESLNAWTRDYRKKRRKEDPEFRRKDVERSKERYLDQKKKEQEDPALLEERRRKNREKTQRYRERLKMQQERGPAETPKTELTEREIKNRELAKLHKLDQKLRSVQDSEFADQLREKNRERKRKK